MQVYTGQLGVSGLSLVSFILYPNLTAQANSAGVESCPTVICLILLLAIPLTRRYNGVSNSLETMSRSISTNWAMWMANWPVDVTLRSWLARQLSQLVEQLTCKQELAVLFSRMYTVGIHRLHILLWYNVCMLLFRWRCVALLMEETRIGTRDPGNPSWR